MAENLKRTTIFLNPSILARIPDKISRSGLIRDLLEKYVNDENEWKDGFRELYEFFASVMGISKDILTTKKALITWNNLLNKKDLDLISKLGGKLNG